MNKNVYRFFYLTPDSIRHYHLDSCGTVSLYPAKAKHYVSDDPDGQKAVIEENFRSISYKQFYGGTTFWKSVDFKEVFKQVTVNYEIVPEEERRSDDFKYLTDLVYGVTLADGGSSDGGSLAQVAAE